MVDSPTYRTWQISSLFRNIFASPTPLGTIEESSNEVTKTVFFSCEQRFSLQSSINQSRHTVVDYIFWETTAISFEIAYRGSFVDFKQRLRRNQSLPGSTSRCVDPGWDKRLGGASLMPYSGRIFLDPRRIAWNGRRDWPSSRGRCNFNNPGDGCNVRFDAYFRIRCSFSSR